MAAFAKYDGVDGEVKDAEHEKWIDVLSTDWGFAKPRTAVLVPGAVVLHRASNA